MARSASYSLLTELSLEECFRRLSVSVDPKKFSLFSLSGNIGKEPFIARIAGPFFELEKRRYYRNDFAPIFFGQFSSEGKGTRIHGHFDVSSWVRLFMKVWLTIAAILAIPTVGSALLKMMRQGKLLSGDDWMLIAVPCGLVAWGILLPKLGRWMGRGQERAVLEFLQSTFLARPAPSTRPIEPE